MRESMEIYPRTAAERAMKLQEVLLRATTGKIKWWEAAELIGISERQMRRWRKRLEDEGPEGFAGPATAEAKQQTRAEGAGRRGSEPVSGQVLRSERAALP
ncbi:MAG TPA: helix-turn-helix domain-containing protein [Edaphobacter sp.]|nr:helix-turn-helix domain-containing protein [Edaphobacter sp.]